MAKLPSCGAEKPASEPRKLPTGVRAAATITTSCFGVRRQRQDSSGRCAGQGKRDDGTAKGKG